MYTETKISLEQAHDMPTRQQCHDPDILCNLSSAG